MKSAQTFGVHYVVRLNKESNGKYPIYARIVVNKSRVEMSTKQYISLKDWHEGKGKAKSRTDELRLLNSYLEEVRAKLGMHYRELKLSDDLVTADVVKNSYLGIQKKQDNYTLLWLAQQHNTVMKPVLRWGTLKNYHTTERYLRMFLKSQYDSGDIYLRKLNYSFINSFEFYVRSTPLKTNDPCTNNGTMKHLERLRKMVTWAVKNEWIDKDPFAAFQLKFKHSVRQILTDAELDILEERRFDDPMLQKVKDLFVFSCYTGLAYVDVMALKPENIVVGIDGFQWIKTCRTKTDISVDVPILEPAVAIIEKYKLTGDEPQRDTLFPFIANQVMNRCLKVVGEICGLHKKLTFHLARHTFATTVALCNGVPIESISKMLGHSKIATTMIYAKVVQTKISADMLSLRNKLNQGKKGKLSVAV